MSEVKNIIGNLIEIDWLNELYELQPDNAKLPYNYAALKQSILKYGFGVPFAVWKNKNKWHCIDGHSRKLILTELQSEGVEVPKLLKAYEIIVGSTQFQMGISIIGFLTIIFVVLKSGLMGKDKILKVLMTLWFM